MQIALSIVSWFSQVLLCQNALFHCSSSQLHFGKAKLFVLLFFTCGRETKMGVGESKKQGGLKDERPH